MYKTYLIQHSTKKDVGIFLMHAFLETEQLNNETVILTACSKNETIHSLSA